MSAKRLLCIAANAVLIGLAGCVALTKPSEKRLVALEKPIGLHQGSLWGRRNFIEVRGSYVDAPIGESVPQEGRLWVYFNDYNNSMKAFVPIEDLSSFAGSGYYKDTYLFQAKLRSGDTFNVPGRWFYWCGSGVTPNRGVRIKELVGCYQVEGFSGAIQNVSSQGASSTLSSVSKPIAIKDLINSGESIFAVYSPEETVIERGRVLAAVRSANEARERQEKAQKAAESARFSQQERERFKMMSGARIGTEVNCTSNTLLSRSEPIGDFLGLNCAGLGSTTIGDLKKYGWSTRVVGRIPRETLTGMGDSIDVLAIKRR